MNKFKAGALALALVLLAGSALSPTTLFAQNQEKDQKSGQQDMSMQGMNSGAQMKVTAEQKGNAPAAEPRRITVKILGMSCPFCAYGVQQKLKKLEGVEKLDVVLDTGLATLDLKDGADISNEILEKTVKDAGFEAVRIVRNFESEFSDFDKKTSS